MNRSKWNQIVQRLWINRISCPLFLIANNEDIFIINLINQRVCVFPGLNLSSFTCIHWWYSTIYSLWLVHSIWYLAADFSSILSRCLLLLLLFRTIVSIYSVYFLYAPFNSITNNSDKLEANCISSSILADWVCVV